MALKTYSQFYYVEPITLNNNALSFTENGVDEIIAEVLIGRYTPTLLAIAVQNALNSTGSLSYTVTFNRKTRRLKIDVTSGSFSLLGASGSALAFSIFDVIGFGGTDTVYGGTATGISEVGEVFAPQFFLQDYISPEQYQEAVGGVRSVTASGEVEVVRFGIQRFVEMNIRFQNNGLITGYPFRENSNGYNDLVNFMDFVTNIYPVEFMTDINNQDDYMNLILETTENNSNGLGYKLKERTDLNLPNVYDTGKLKFRKI